MPTCSTERTRITCAVVLSPPSISTARVTRSRAISSAVFFLRGDLRDHGLGHLVVQAVGAEHQHVAGFERDSRRVRRNKHLRTERTDENVARVGLLDLAVR